MKIGLHDSLLQVLSYFSPAISNYLRVFSFLESYLFVPISHSLVRLLEVQFSDDDGLGPRGYLEAGLTENKICLTEVSTLC